MIWLPATSDLISRHSILTGLLATAWVYQLCSCFGAFALLSPVPGLGGLPGSGCSRLARSPPQRPSQSLSSAIALLPSGPALLYFPSERLRIPAAVLAPCPAVPGGQQCDPAQSGPAPPLACCPAAPLFQEHFLQTETPPCFCIHFIVDRYFLSWAGVPRNSPTRGFLCGDCCPGGGGQGAG